MFKVKALSFSEIGKKDNQEDRVFPDPLQVKPEQRYFILCDGMGGHDNGEVASETVSSALGQYFDAHPVEVADEAYFNDALAYAYSRLDLVDTGAEKKMGTTLTCLLLNPNGFLAAHIGDSRIYQFRDGEIIFKTTDHSLVNDLLKAGEITEDEAKNYPRKNVITRAMQPNSRRAKADIFVSDDIRPGDYFFLCCDGVLERMTDELLCRIMKDSGSTSSKLAKIKAECDKGTKDNYTSWLITIEGSKNQRNAEKCKNVRCHSKVFSWALPVVLVALLCGCIWLWKKQSSINEQREIQINEQVKQIENLKETNLSLEQEVQAVQAERDSLSQIIEEIKESLK